MLKGRSSRLRERSALSRAANEGAVAIVLLPPALTAAQELAEEKLPPGAEVRHDRDGNRALFVPVSHLEPDREHSIGVYRAKIRRYRIDVDLSRFRTPLATWRAPEELRVHTENLPQLLIEDPEIRGTRERLRARSETLEDYAREAFLEVRRRMRYHSDGRFDPAPVVLKQGHGTCTEFTYATMALLRSAGIPSRMAWNYLGNGQPDFNNKLAEFWHPQLGWLPIEPLAPPATGPGTTHARHIIWAQLRTPFQEWIGTRDRLATVRGISARVQLKVTVAGTGAYAPKTRASTGGSAPGKNTARETKDGPRVE